VVTVLSTWHNRDTKEGCRKTAKEVEVFQKPAVVIDGRGAQSRPLLFQLWVPEKKKFEMAEKITFLDFGGLPCE
jgi:hypothetical protein